MMFKDILSTFLEFFIVYVLFIIAFALGFYTEMRNAVSIIIEPRHEISNNLTFDIVDTDEPLQPPLSLETPNGVLSVA